MRVPGSTERSPDPVPYACSELGYVAVMTLDLTLVRDVSCLMA